MNDLRELKEGDTIAFKKPSGNASITRVPNKGFYFTPSKTGMQLEGESIPIMQYETFTYKGYKILNGKPPRVIKLYIVRHSNGHMCQISEAELVKNFGLKVY